MKKRVFLILGMALSFSALISCGNGIFENPYTSEKQKGTLSIRNVNVAYRTVRPNVSQSQITDLVLKGTRSGSTEETLATGDSITDLSANEIELQTGYWDFVLTAKVENIPFKSEKDNFLIEADKTNNLAFVLTAEDSYGGLNITIRFTDANVNKVVATLKNASGDTSIGEPEEYTTFLTQENENNEIEKLVTFTKSITSDSEKLSDGTYSLDFDFYAEGTVDSDGNEIPINTLNYLVRIASGFTTTASQLISINETYTITYEYDVNDDEIQVAGQGTLPAKYSRKTDTFTLPELTKTDYIFGGWYTNSSFEGTKITSIPKGSTGNKTLYPKLVKAVTNPDVSLSFDIDPASDIEVTVPDLQNLTSANLTFTAEDDYSTYSWEIDGIPQSSTSNTLIIDASSWVTGTYDITLTATKDDGTIHSFYANLLWTKVVFINFISGSNDITIPAQTVYEGNLITEPTEITPAYGWFESDQSGTPISYEPYDFSKAPAKSMYLVAINTITLKGDYDGFRSVIYDLAAGETAGTGNVVLSAKHFKESETAPAKTTGLKYLDENGSLIPAWYDENDETIYYYNGTGVKPYMNENSSKLFVQIKSLETIDISGFDSSRVTSTSQMFHECTNLQSIVFGNDFNTSNVTNMRYMFDSCERLTSIDLSGFNTANVTDMAYMFRMCSSLTEINFPETFTTANVTDMAYMFSLYSGTVLDLSTFNTANVTAMYNMFDRCYDLVTIYATEDFVVDQLEEGKDTNMFNQCVKITGGNGTTFSTTDTDKTRACIDTPETPGYFTAK